MSLMAAADYASLFNALPGLYLVLKPDLTIAAASNAYLQATITKRENIIGRYLFDVFPDNPADAGADGVSKLGDSLRYVLDHKQPHRMATQKYDIRKPDQQFEERYWGPLNTPVLNDKNEIIYIIHAVEDVTSANKTKENLNNFLDTTADPIIILDENGLIKIVNQQAYLAFGYSKNEIIGKPVNILLQDAVYNVPGSMKNGSKKIIQAKSTNGNEPYTAIRKDGTLFPAAINFTVVNTEEGLMITAAVKDITVQTKQQEQFQLLYRQIDQANDAIFTVDENRKITSWNMGAQKLYGYTIEEALGKESFSFLQTDMPAKEVEALTSMIAEQDHWVTELKRKTKDGKDVYIQASISTIKNKQGTVTGYVAVNINITEQKKLYRQVAHFANLVEQSSEAIISRDLDDRLISWNSGAENMFGFTKEEAIGRTAIELGFMRFSPAELLEAETALTDTGSWQSEKQFYHKNGSFFSGAVNANVLKNEDGNMTSVVFIIKDITAGKKLEAQLKRSNEELEIQVKKRTEEIISSERRYRYLFENNPLPMWVIALDDFRFLDVNEMATIVYGYSREEFLSMTAVDIRPPEEKARFVQSNHSFETNKINYNKGIWKHRKKDGSVITVEIIAHSIVFSGIPARLILANDITEKRKAEEQLTASEKRFRALLENNYDIISLMDRSFNVIYRSPSAERILGWTNEELEGQSGTINIHPYDLPRVRSIIKNLMENPGTSLYCSFRNRHKNGHYLWVEGTIRNLLDDEDINAIVFNFRDITARKEAEEKVQQMNTELEEKIAVRTGQLKKSNQELEAFSYSVSHDLRAPLRGIIGFTSILEEEYTSKLDDEAKRITGIIKNNTLKMGNLIDDLLAFSRIGQHQVDKLLINTSEMVKQVISAQEKNSNSIQWTIPVLPDAYGDLNTIRQVWINLISNAVKYSSRKQDQHIEIGSYNENDKIVFFIKDNGVGFDKKYADKLFKVFQRLHSTAEFEGTGIGLAIVEKVISKHGGTVWAEAIKGQGATFYFSLPQQEKQTV